MCLAVWGIYYKEYHCGHFWFHHLLLIFVWTNRFQCNHFKHYTVTRAEKILPYSRQMSNDTRENNWTLNSEGTFCCLHNGCKQVIIFHEIKYAKKYFLKYYGSTLRKTHFLWESLFPTLYFRGQFWNFDIA